jgi:hypothetical protein
LSAFCIIIELKLREPQIMNQAQVYFVVYSAYKYFIKRTYNGEVWFDFKDQVDNIQDYRLIEFAISQQHPDLKKVTVEGLQPLRFTERHGNEKVFFGKGQAVPQQPVH